jgi:gliding motility-associated-like protein
MTRLRGFIVLMCIFFTGLTSVKATHLVGGEMSYKFKGSDGFGNNLFEITLYIYQDCLTGLPDVIAIDNPAYIGIFTKAGFPYLRVDSIFKSEDIPVPPNFSNSCVNNPPATCLRRVKFTRTYALPPNNDGYRVIYSRCCRNETVNNIVLPGKVGATYFCDIPPINKVFNNSAAFKNYPPQIICINNPLVYDHSATDADGDSLSYELCDAYAGGSQRDSKPFPPQAVPQAIGTYNDNPDAPSYGYQTGYSTTKPMGGSPLVQINSRTGLITGTPNVMGRFVVSVCCNEWRNGVKINTVRREFQFVVTNCSKAVVANIPQFSDEVNTYIVNCKSKTVSFVNNSTGGFAYDWSFGLPGAISTDFSPTFTYPDTGIYTVKLIVNKGSTCPDSIDRLVKIFPEHKADFIYDGLLCPNTPIQFTDKSDATYKPINQWRWSFGDNTTSDEQNPTHSYAYGSLYTATLVSTTIKGCKDTMTRTLDVDRFMPFAGNDTFIVKGEHINFNASGGVEYTWTPGDKLNFTNISNPRGDYPDTGVYIYNVHIKSDKGCEGDDKIKVTVVNQASLFLPTAFTPNGDGMNDFFKMLCVGYAKINFFRVFNRFGQQVYHTTTIGRGWDGKMNGRDADMGTYFWVLSVVDRFGKDEVLKGDITLLR